MLIQFKVESDYTRAGRDIRERTRVAFYTIACGKISAWAAGGGRVPPICPTGTKVQYVTHPFGEICAFVRQTV